MNGDVYYLFAFDVSNEIRTQLIKEILSKRPEAAQIRTGSTAPRDVKFYRPLTVELPSEEIDTALGKRTLRRCVKVYDVGVISIEYRVAFETSVLGELIPYHQLAVAGEPLSAHAAKLADEVTKNIAAAIVKPNLARRPAEAYTVFAITKIEGVEAGHVPEWVNTNRAEIAGLLLEEAVPERIAEDQVRESMRHAFSYTTGDMSIIDWDAALVIDQTGYVDDVLYVIELANIQLEEWQVLDDRLDEFFSRAYDDLERYYAVKRVFPTPDKILRSLRTIRMDLTKMSEEVSNITKFLGDWYLARLYLACKDRFHLGQWEASVDQKLDQIDGLYRLVHTEINERRMQVMEFIIVALFLFDVAVLLWGRK